MQQLAALQSEIVMPFYIKCANIKSNVLSMSMYVGYETYCRRLPQPNNYARRRSIRAYLRRELSSG